MAIRKSNAVIKLCYFLLLTSPLNGFTIFRRKSPASPRTSIFDISIEARRYGPPDASDTNRPDVMDQGSRAALKYQFRDLLSRTMEIENPDLLPRELANSLDLIFSLRGYEGTAVISEVVEEAQKRGPIEYQRTLDMLETILTFAEDFVNEATQLDEQNKNLLGKIIKTMTSKEHKDREKEELLDRLLEEEKDNFTPGFLRHLEGECNRIANAPKVTPESARLLEVIRVIQTRVLEEIGKDMGEAAIVLGQLMGYENDDELVGVLDAGLTVRGGSFASEMKALTEEALDGFNKVPGGADPGLVERVKSIDTRLNQFLGEKTATP